MPTYKFTVEDEIKQCNDCPCMQYDSLEHMHCGVDRRITKFCDCPLTLVKEREKLPALLPCKCGRVRQRTRILPLSEHGELLYERYCGCGQRGGYGKNEREARIKWNEMVKEGLR